jgi:hypothetical protein
MIQRGPEGEADFSPGRTTCNAGCHHRLGRAPQVENAPAANTLRMSTARRVLIVLASVVVLLALVLGVAWYEFTGKEQISQHRYAKQVAGVSLPSDFKLVGQDEGGTYFAAGNGPFASRSYRTPRSLENTVSAVTKALTNDGYDVSPNPAYATSLSDVPFIHLLALKGDSPLEDISRGDVYDLPVGYIPAAEGLTGVLIEVKDAGRSR